ncbi:MAG: RNA-binding protein [Pseudoalteromonas sp.]|uniref:RNA recognition motif domain-containing protein n=1 Tax=Pseudoalteromonas sp. TaxID=53249 RepID=UPI001DD40857|nr:RNA-binding protein [Pseudoalteromonas sp.]NRA76854.1 RNA-binding protein [Pseudoalteromonas sp.]
MKNHDNKLFIGGLNFTTTREELMEEFSRYGKVLDLKVPITAETGMTKGYCFLTMASKEEAENLMEKLNGKEYAGRTIGVKKYVQKQRPVEHRTEM